MPRVWVRMTLPEREPEEVLRSVTDFAKWEQASDAVRAVRVEPQSDGSEITHWEVNFRQGVMRWTERDVTDFSTNRAVFDLIEGDPLLFNGTWVVERVGDDCVLVFDSEFDLGMPSLGHVLDPIAVEAVEEAIESVLIGLYGSEARLEFTAAAPPRDESRVTS